MMDVSPQLWSEINKQLGKRVGKDVADRWFCDGVIEGLSEEQFSVRFPTPLHVTWIETYYRNDLEEVVAKNLGSSIKVQLTASDMSELPQHLEVEESQLTDEEPAGSNAVVTEDDLARFRQSVEPIPNAKVKAANLNPKFTFDSFVVGDNSQYCHATATAVSQSPGSQYNPVLFYGGTGLGKTHLMSAIGHQVLEKHPKKKVIFVTAEQFTNDFIDAVQASKLADFRAKNRSVDVLLIDDIHLVAGKDATQEEF
ncbi:MAG: DnaA/Hda family protein, partial [Verrucomicrobiota bacterium]